MVYLGFPGREWVGAASSPKVGVQNYYLAHFSRKLDENERNWTERGLALPLDPPIEIVNVIVLEKE